MIQGAGPAVTHDDGHHGRSCNGTFFTRAPPVRENIKGYKNCNTCMSFDDTIPGRP